MNKSAQLSTSVGISTSNKTSNTNGKVNKQFKIRNSVLDELLSSQPSQYSQDDIETDNT